MNDFHLQKTPSKKERIDKENFSSDEDSIDRQYGHLYKK